MSAPPSAPVDRDDIRAAVAAGILTEAQAARLTALAARRHGMRLNMTDDDEPFELFRGFAEIFVTVGLALLTAGFVGLALILGNPLAVPLVAAVLAALLARYFTLRRRMTLPSIFLTASFALAVLTLVMAALAGGGMSVAAQRAVQAVVTGLALLGWFRVFRVPFTLFLIGLCGLLLAVSLRALLLPDALAARAMLDGGGLRNLLDLGANPANALTLLVFGLAAFAAAMRFDMADPHRVTRNAANAFWLHILAAPAIVNVVAMSLLNIPGSAGYLLAALGLGAITFVALVIDRRSFLTAGIAYIGVILSWALEGARLGEGWSLVLALLLMGAFITWIGAGWTGLRLRAMRLVPRSLARRLPPVPETVPETTPDTPSETTTDDP